MRILVLALLASATLSASEFQVKFSSAAHSAPLDGRLIFIVSKDTRSEPRFQVSWGVQTAQIFGVDVDAWRPGEAVRIDAATPGHPLPRLADLPPGKYRVQAVLNVYETFHRADGHVVKMHMDRGEGQRWDASPGNLYSHPQDVEIGASGSVPIELTEVIPPIPAPQDTKFIKHVSIESKLLSQFWGRPMFIGASVLLLADFDEHPERRYPVAFLQSHFGGDFFMFRETPPAPGQGGSGMRGAATAYQFYQDWTSGRLPKVLLVTTNHATPIYDDSYGVNTANAGPYGDALTQELYPFIEKQYHAIGAPWARVVFGGSTGGWMTLAEQIFYPDFFGGAWGFCPDPVDFHAFQSINLYSDSNAYWDQGPFARLPKLLGRLPNDHVLSTMELFSKQEAVLGTRGRSGGQMDAFHATFGPTDADGYPAKLWNSETGEIDPAPGQILARTL